MEEKDCSPIDGATIQKELDPVLSSTLTRGFWLPFLASDRSSRERVPLVLGAQRGGSGVRETGLESFESSDARGRARVPEGWTLPVSRNWREGGRGDDAPTAMTDRRSRMSLNRGARRERRKEATPRLASPRGSRCTEEKKGKEKRKNEKKDRKEDARTHAVGGEVHERSSARGPTRSDATHTGYHISRNVRALNYIISRAWTRAAPPASPAIQLETYAAICSLNCGCSSNRESLQLSNCCCCCGDGCCCCCCCCSGGGRIGAC